MIDFIRPVKMVPLSSHFAPEMKPFLGVGAGDLDNTSDEANVRLVACPYCKSESVYHRSNPSRPFCSPRCRAMDLGAWANEDFRVIESNPPEDSDFKDG